MIAVVNLFHENTAGKVGQKERIDIIEAQNPEFLELKDHLGWCPSLIGEETEAQISSMTYSGFPDSFPFSFHLTQCFLRKENSSWYKQ